MKDVAKRRSSPWDSLGFVLLIPLGDYFHRGLDSPPRRKRWQILHRSIYVAAICGVIHYYWLVKSDVRKPLLYAGILAILLLWRLATWFVNQKGTLAPATAKTMSPKPL